MLIGERTRTSHSETGGQSSKSLPKSNCHIDKPSAGPFLTLSVVRWMCLIHKILYINSFEVTAERMGDSSRYVWPIQIKQGHLSGQMTIYLINNINKKLEKGLGFVILHSILNILLICWGKGGLMWVDNKLR